MSIIEQTPIKDKIFYQKELGILGFLDNSGYELPEEVLMNIYRGLSIEDLFKISTLSSANKRHFKYIIQNRDIKLDNAYSMKYMISPDFKDLLSNAKTVSLDIDIRAEDIKKYSSNWCDKPDNVISVKINSKRDITLVKFLNFFNFKNFKNLETLILVRHILDTPLIGLITSFKKLRELNLSYSVGYFNLLRQLETLPNLVYLKINRTELDDLTHFQNLTNLTYLDLSYNDINDILPLRTLTNLTHLELNSNKIDDLTPFQNLTNLTYLDLSYNDIEDILPLRTLTNLVYLNLQSTDIYDLTPLQNLTSLTDVILKNTQIGDLTPLENLTTITHLNLQTTQIFDITPLQNLNNLKYLNLQDTYIDDVKPLQNLTNLTQLIFK